jgi:hypothetical protein
MKTYITDPSDIAAVKRGEGELNGKPVLLVSSDMASATKRIFAELAKTPVLAIVGGLGLCIKVDAKPPWRKISLAEFRALVLEAFTLVKEQIGDGGKSRLEVLDGPPNALWLPTVLQARWLTNEVQGWFQRVDPAHNRNR